LFAHSLKNKTQGALVFYGGQGWIRTIVLVWEQISYYY